MLQAASETLGDLAHQRSLVAVATIVRLLDRIVTTALSPAKRLVRGDFIRLAPDVPATLRHRFGLGSTVVIELAVASQLRTHAAAGDAFADPDGPSKSLTARETNQSS